MADVGISIRDASREPLDGLLDLVVTDSRTRQVVTMKRGIAGKAAIGTHERYVDLAFDYLGAEGNRSVDQNDCTGSVRNAPRRELVQVLVVAIDDVFKTSRLSEAYS